MKTAIESSLFLSIVSGLAYLFLPGVKNWSKWIFLAALTIFVALSLGSTQRSLKEVPAPSLDVDQAELSLKMLNAFRSTQNKLSAGNLHKTISDMQYQGAPLSQMLVSKVYMQVIASLEKRLPLKQDGHAQKESQDESRILADIAIVCGDSGDASLRPKLLQATQQLSICAKYGKPQLHELSQVIWSIYSEDHISSVQADRFEAVLQNNLPAGWYRSQSLERLYIDSGNYSAYEKLKRSTDAATLSFANRTIALLTIMSIAALTGVITILVFLATEPRQAKNNIQASNTTPWSLVTTYGVMVGWLATQLIIQSVLAATAKPQLKYLLHAGSITTAVTTMAIYILTTGPALLYIWWFACRPFNLRFVDGIRLKLNTAAGGFFKLFICGMLTWCAAIPVVLGCQLLALKLFSSQGSNNPVLSLVREAALSPNPLLIVIYFLILGVLAPLAEETLFRGFIYSSLRTKLGKFTSAGISAAMFAAVHLDPGAFISLFALGFLFALVRERYQSILPSMVAHGMWNCGTFMLVLVLLGGS